MVESPRPATPDGPNDAASPDPLLPLHGEEGGKPVVPEVVRDEGEPASAVLRRIRLISVGAWGVFAVFTLISSGFAGLVALTCTALVVMINFLWLEGIVSSILRPDPDLQPWRLTWRTMARFALLAAAITVTIFVARLNTLSVLLGFSIVVVGIIGEALYSTYRSFAG